MRFTDLLGRRVTVWGYGREGQSAHRRCVQLGINAAVAEPDRTEPPTTPETVIGAEAEALLLRSDVVIKSPGVPVTSPLYQRMRDAGVTITSVTDLWLNDNAQRTVAVTGTKGKSTTAAVINHLLNGLGTRSALLGNIGAPVLDEPHPLADVVVLEISSYQAQSLTIAPRWAVLTSLYPEHLPWHGSEEAYYNDKLRLIDGDPEIVFCAPQPALLNRVSARLNVGSTLVVTDQSVIHVQGGDLVWPGGTRIASTDLPLIGSHNAENIALALNTVCGVLRLDPDENAPALGSLLATFAPLTHRLEVIPSNDGRRWIDDSLATTPAAVVASLEALGGTDICVIVGGADRGLDQQPLLRFLAKARRVEAILVGEAGRRLSEQLAENPALGATWRIKGSFAEAALWAHDHAAFGTVLFSPAAPSQDEYRDYVEKSDEFRRIALS